MFSKWNFTWPEDQVLIVPIVWIVVVDPIVNWLSWVEVKPSKMTFKFCKLLSLIADTVGKAFFKNSIKKSKKNKKNLNISFNSISTNVSYCNQSGQLIWGIWVGRCTQITQTAREYGRSYCGQLSCCVGVWRDCLQISTRQSQCFLNHDKYYL